MTGSAEVLVVPDVIDVQVGVEARNRDLQAAFALQEAQTKHRERSSAGARRASWP
jgi:uncharacterized protein YggE